MKRKTKAKAIEMEVEEIGPSQEYLDIQRAVNNLLKLVNQW